MGILLACGDGLVSWRGSWRRVPCPILRADLASEHAGQVAAVDNLAGLLWHDGELQPCDRSIEALRLWQGFALLLSSDTDCLSLWDAHGPVRMVRAGIYPQDMHLVGDHAAVCGGLDGMLRLYSLPGLELVLETELPGMPERVSIHGDQAYVLSLLPEPEVHTAVLRVDLRSRSYVRLMELPGLPGAVLAEGSGAWIAGSETLLHSPDRLCEADCLIDGFGLVRHLSTVRDRLLITDPVAGICAMYRRGALSILYRGDVGQAIFTT